MFKTLTRSFPFILILLSILSSCGVQKGSHSQLYDPKEVAELSKKLHIKLSNRDKEDNKNMSLYAEVSLWLGTPYRYGGNTKKGVDCSGFTHYIYKKIYNKSIPRSTSGLEKSNAPKVSKKKLKTGDIMLFATSKKNRKKVNHVGIYLKDNYFIHASVSSGVIVSNINEEYYKRTWKKGLRLK